MRVRILVSCWRGGKFRSQKNANGVWGRSQEVEKSRSLEARKSWDSGFGSGSAVTDCMWAQRGLASVAGTGLWCGTRTREFLRTSTGLCGRLVVEIYRQNPARSVLAVTFRLASPVVPDASRLPRSNRELPFQPLTSKVSCLQSARGDEAAEGKIGALLARLAWRRALARLGTREARRSGGWFRLPQRPLPSW